MAKKKEKTPEDVEVQEPETEAALDGAPGQPAEPTEDPAPDQEPEQAPAKPKHWCATKPFMTMYQGQMLHFVKDQHIDVPGLGEFLHKGGSPVESREE